MAGAMRVYSELGELEDPYRRKKYLSLEFHMQPPGFPVPEAGLIVKAVERRLVDKAVLILTDCG